MSSEKHSTGLDGEECGTLEEKTLRGTEKRDERDLRKLQKWTSELHSGMKEIEDDGYMTAIFIENMLLNIVPYVTTWLW